MICCPTSVEPVEQGGELGLQGRALPPITPWQDEHGHIGRVDVLKGTAGLDAEAPHGLHKSGSKPHDFDSVAAVAA
jgi:hypothetical protein